MPASSTPPPAKSTPKRAFSALDALIPLAIIAGVASIAAAVVWQATLSCHDETTTCHADAFDIGSGIAFFGPMIAAVVAAVFTLDAAARGANHGRPRNYGLVAIVGISMFGLLVAIAASG